VIPKYHHNQYQFSYRIFFSVFFRKTELKNGEKNPTYQKYINELLKDILILSLLLISQM